MKNYSIIYYIKFFIYGGISAYDYSINSKWVIAWLILALLVLAFGIVVDVECRIEKLLKQTQSDNIHQSNH